MTASAASVLIGRDAEVRALRKLIAQGTRNGQALVILGDPGIGKSALLGVAASVRPPARAFPAPARALRRPSAGDGGAMSQDRQWVIDLLRRLGYTQAAEEAARELPDPVSMEEIKKFGNRHGISHDEIMSQMGGSP